MTPADLNTICVESLTSLDLSEYVVVVGSGPSSPYIAPSGVLQESLCKRCGIERKGDEMFWALAQRAFDASAADYHQVILDHYDALPYWQSKTYTHIANIPFRGFITFNYDDQLPSACQQVMGTLFREGFTVYPPRSGQTFADASDFVGVHRQVFPLHGYRDHQNPEWHKQIILKTSDYDHHYSNPISNHLFKFWKNLLVFTPCLFVGTSLEEPGLLKVIEDLRSRNPEALIKNRHIHLVTSEQDPSTQLYPEPKRSLGAIEQLRYDRLDRRYSGLIQVLGALSGLPTESPSPQAPAPTPISATENFNFFEP